MPTTCPCMSGAPPPTSTPSPTSTPLPPPLTAVADLVSRLTPEEKCSALDTSNPAIPRLGVPHMPSGEGLHGVVCGCVGAPAPGSTGCPTSFPSPIGLGATFDKDLYLAVGGVVGVEARAIDNANGGSGLVLYAPNIK